MLNNQNISIKNHQSILIKTLNNQIGTVFEKNSIFF
jgi:hypothetical protein